MDISDTIVPKSDQLNADDLLPGPRTFTISEVGKGSAEQPVAIHLAELPDGRPFYPCKTMRRILVAAWGKESSVYVGRRLTLYCDPSVKWGGQDVGGIRISHLSHIPRPLSLALTVTRGKRAPYDVKPLDDAPAAPLAKRVDEAVKAFAGIGIKVSQLEESVGKKRTSWQPGDIAELVVVYQSIQRGDVSKDDAFPTGVTADEITGRTVEPKPATGPEPKGWEA